MTLRTAIFFLYFSSTIYYNFANGTWIFVFRVGRSAYLLKSNYLLRIKI